jgi:glutaredoxin
MFCRKVKEFLSQRAVPYTDRDVSTDNTALEELAALHLMTTPVVKIDGQVVIGFDQARLEQLLKE